MEGGFQVLYNTCKKRIQCVQKSIVRDRVFKRLVLEDLSEYYPYSSW